MVEFSDRVYKITFCKTRLCIFCIFYTFYFFCFKMRKSF